MLSQEVLVPILLVIISLVYSLLTLRGKNQSELKALLIERALELFLYAEKQGWTGKEKMEWALKQIIDNFSTEDLRKALKNQSILGWMQDVYDRFKKSV